jgi:SAM-dependent methyltransferase
MSDIILNLGCGARTSSRCVNIDWSPYLKLKRLHSLGDLLARAFLSQERLSAYQGISGAIVAHDLRKGIPRQTESVDCVYHCHFLEHLDRPIAIHFLSEVLRVLKPGGIQRIVVPDFHAQCAAYCNHFESQVTNGNIDHKHEDYIQSIIEQLVRNTSVGSSLQTPFRRYIEHAVLGSASTRGELHRWMYDEITLRSLLSDIGFLRISARSYSSSSIPDWEQIGLDRSESGAEYMPGSLYMEAIKPLSNPQL